MDELIAGCATLWTTEYESKVIDILKHGRTGKKQQAQHMLTRSNTT